MKRKLVLGDIHGELEKLEAVSRKAAFDFDNDLLIQVGDICDRGRSSYEVVEWLKQCKHLVLIEGNHDQWLKAYMKSASKQMEYMWVQQGGKTTLESYALHAVDPVVHESFYDRQVPYYIDEERNVFVHGGFNRHRKIVTQPKDSFAWDRELVQEMMEADAPGKLITADDFKHVYIGHTPTLYWNITVPVTRAGITNIDTGAGKGGKLSMMDVETGEYWQS
ncbi:MAG: metallophosphoesterase [Bacteroidetes bacterium]|nr:metallophosphoesterase [Bacteroidota bacterium]